MTRWINHWQSLPKQNRIGASICMVVFIVVIITLVIQISDLVAEIQMVIARG